MATLISPFWDKLPPFLREVIVEIGCHSFSERFYLAGGTALALQIGHRQSVDLDFFAPSDELLDDSRKEIVQTLKNKFVVKEVSSELGTLQLNIQGSYVGFYSYGYPLIGKSQVVENVTLAGLIDIGLMKMDAIMGRGARKDFYDLYFIAQSIPLDHILDGAKEKYIYSKNYGMMVLAALVDFDHADGDKPIETSPSILWDDVKAFFTLQVSKISHTWFENSR